MMMHRSHTMFVNLRQTKRHITQEIEEWEEEVEGDGAQSAEQPRLQWGFMEKDGANAVPGKALNQIIEVQWFFFKASLHNHEPLPFHSSLLGQVECMPSRMLSLTRQSLLPWLLKVSR